MTPPRRIYFVSDRTGITAETLGKSLLTQFDHMQFVLQTLAFVDTPERAATALRQIQRRAAPDEPRPLVFGTVLDADTRAVFADADIRWIDFFQAFLPDLQRELNVAPSGALGKSHAIGPRYHQRMDAVNFSLEHDDGLGSHLEQADLILLGVSRCGKTPTSLYLALQHGLRAANYPLTPEDFTRPGLPAPLIPHRAKLFGLTIQAQRLAHIREQRRPGSDYAALETCRREIQQAEALYRADAIPFLDTSERSIEEIAATILNRAQGHALPASRP